jgi:acyl-CoA synthetase (AMP-forming)/AMP-acid ligase II
VAGGLRSMGIKPSERVAYLGKNSDRLLELIFGAAMARATCVVLNWRLAMPEWRDIIEDSGACLLFADEEFVEQAQALAGVLPQLTRIITINAGTVPHAQVSDYDELVLSHEPHLPEGVLPEDDFLQLYTSGTTGRPKGVPQTHAMHLSQRAQWEGRIGPFPQGDRVLVFMPCFHAAGITYPLFALAYGTQVEIHRAADPAKIMQSLASGRISTTVMVPTLLAMLVPKLQPGMFPALKRIHYGASAIEPLLLEKVMEVFGCDMVQIYAATETTAALCILSPEDHRQGLISRELLTSAGKPGGDAQLRIVDVGGQDVPQGTAGEILVKSGSTLRSYWRNLQATADAIKGGWYYTGDMGRIDANGYVYVVDRVKDMIITGGENVYSFEVENALTSYPGLAEFAVVGVPDAQWGEVVTACVVPKAGENPSLESIQEFLRPLLAGYKIPRRLEVMSVLPRNPMGKLQKHLLRSTLK